MKFRPLPFRSRASDPAIQPYQDYFRIKFSFFSRPSFSCLSWFLSFEQPEGAYENDESRDSNLIWFRPKAGLGFTRVRSVFHLWLNFVWVKDRA
jgi:hypothetical protein